MFDISLKTIHSFRHRTTHYRHICQAIASRVTTAAVDDCAAIARGRPATNVRSQGRSALDTARFLSGRRRLMLMGIRSHHQVAGRRLADLSAQAPDTSLHQSPTAIFRSSQIQRLATAPMALIPVNKQHMVRLSAKADLSRLFAAPRHLNATGALQRCRLHQSQQEMQPQAQSRNHRWSFGSGGRQRLAA